MTIAETVQMQELLQRVTKIEELLTQIADQVQRLAAAGEKDLMHQVYPPQDPDEAA